MASSPRRGRASRDAAKRRLERLESSESGSNPQTPQSQQSPRMRQMMISSRKMSIEDEFEDAISPRARASTKGSLIDEFENEPQNDEETGFEMPVINFPFSHSTGAMLTLEHMEYMGKTVDRLHATSFHMDAPRRRGAIKTVGEKQLLQAAEGDAMKGDLPRNHLMEASFLQCAQPQACDLQLLKLLPPEVQDQLVKDQQRIVEYFRYKNSICESQKFSKMQDTANTADDALHELNPVETERAAPSNDDEVAEAPEPMDAKQQLLAKYHWGTLRAAAVIVGGVGNKKSSAPTVPAATAARGGPSGGRRNSRDSSSATPDSPRHSVAKKDPLGKVRRRNSFSSNQSAGKDAEHRPASAGVVSGASSPRSEPPHPDDQPGSRCSSTGPGSRRQSLTMPPLLEQPISKKGKSKKSAKKHDPGLPQLTT